MSLLMAIFTFINAWWIMLFFMLPFSIERSDTPQPGQYAAAPKSIRWRRIFIGASILAILVTAGLAWIIDSGLINVRDMT